MGKSADEVYAMAEAAASKVKTDGTSRLDGVNKTETKTETKIDLSSTLFDDDEEEEESDVASVKVDMIKEKGDKLHIAAAGLCSARIPSQCMEYKSMLQVMYSQKIQADCTAFENSLRQQEQESNKKLMQAKQSLRETALEKYQEANKYDLGQCVVEFSKCMQTDNACGEGYETCTTFAAQENMQNSTNGTVATKKKIPGTNFELAQTTLQQLQAKSVICSSVLEQCEKVKDQVYDAFLKGAASVIAVAELNAEADLRTNCLSTVSDCFSKACQDKIDPNDEEGSYDLCISNPSMVKSLCKVQLEPCLLATGGTYESPDTSSLWAGILARLGSMKVDACTKEVKECLLSDDRCGKDYNACIGLSTQQIGELCPTDKLTACMKDNKNNESAVRDYVARIAQGLALNIDNSMATQCQNALTAAMNKFCGDTESCPNAEIDDTVFRGFMSASICKEGTAECGADPYQFSDTDILKGAILPRVIGQADINALDYDTNNIVYDKKGNVSGMDNIFFYGEDAVVDENKGYSQTSLDRVKQALNNSFENIMKEIEADQKVSYCMLGRTFQQFTQALEKKNKTNARFPKLTSTIRDKIARELLSKVYDPYYAMQDELLESDNFQEMWNRLNARTQEIIEEKGLDVLQQNQEKCEELRKYYGDDPEPHFGTGCTSSGRKKSTWGAYAQYDPEEYKCTITKKRWKCKRSVAGCCWDWNTDANPETNNTVSIEDTHVFYFTSTKVTRGKLVNELSSNATQPTSGSSN